MNQFPSITLQFNRLGYKSKSGLYPVYIRIHHRGKTDYLRLKNVPKLSKADWIGDSARGRFVKGQPSINEIIENELANARKLTNELVLRGSAFTVLDIKKHISNPEKSSSFNKFAEDYIRNINRDKHDDEKLAYRTIQSYNAFLVKLNDFNPSIGFHEISPQLVKSFNDYLAGQCKLIKTSRSKHLDKFSRIYDAAALQKLVDFTPGLFRGYKGRSAPQHVKLTVDEIRLFKTKNLEDPVNDFYRTIFYLQLSTGLYYSDVQELKVKSYNITQINERGTKTTVHYLEGMRTKNGEKFVIRLFKDALEILNAHSALKCGAPEDYLFPGLISDVKYNKRLKKIASELGISKKISNKVARHSYGSWMVAIGNTREKLGGALGHTEQKTTQIYSKLSPEQVLQGWIEPDI